MAFDTIINLWNKNSSLFYYGIKVTILLAVVGTVCGLLIGLVLGGMQCVEIEERDSIVVKAIKKVMRFIVSIYVWFFRGTPMMVQAMLLYFGLKSALQWDALTAGMVIISINTGAYMAEIVRAGIQSVDKGQMEAARSIGMTSKQAMLYIIFPQAIRNSFPSIGNQLIVNLKDSSMLNVIGVIELFFQAKSVAGSTMLGTETYFLVALIYLLLTTIATLLLTWIEKRINAPKANGRYHDAV